MTRESRSAYKGLRIKTGFLFLQGAGLRRQRDLHVRGSRVGFTDLMRFLLFLGFTGFLGPLFESGLAQETAPLQALRERQTRIQALVEKVKPAVVVIQPAPGQPGAGSGSGIIVNAGGLVLTAGHVLQATGKKLRFVFPDGHTAEGKAMGANLGCDSALAQITTKGVYPYVEMGELDDIAVGEWCVAMGHPGGFDPGRGAPVRIGRILKRTSRGFFVTDCTLAGGDSGGPVFSLDGRVIGINSSIGGSLAHNMHVGIDAFHTDWERLGKGETWGTLSRSSSFEAGPLSDKNRAMFDAWIIPTKKGVRVKQVWADTAAHKGGLKEGDYIRKINDKPVHDYDTFTAIISGKKPGDTITIVVQREDQMQELSITLDDREKLKNSGDEENTEEYNEE